MMGSRHERRAQAAVWRKTREDTLRKLVDLVRRAVDSKGVPPKESLIVNGSGWSFALSINEFGSAASDGSDHWHFSACLQPVGRGSTVDDWEFLGMACARVGMDGDTADHPVTPFDTTHPNKVHHWAWSGSRDSVVNADLRERMAKALGFLNEMREADPQLVQEALVAAAKDPEATVPIAAALRQVARKDKPS
jgi:hypothetical protein